jgi:hypothetical protein
MTVSGSLPRIPARLISNSMSLPGGFTTSAAEPSGYSASEFNVEEMDGVTQ